MAEVRFSGSRTQMIVAGLMALAFVLSLVAMFMPWWTYAVQSGGFDGAFDSRPFDRDSVLEDEGDDLGTWVMIVGILWLVTIVGTLTSTSLAVFRMMSTSQLGRAKIYATLGTAALGLLTVILAVIFWPMARNNDPGGVDLYWWDEFSTSGTTLSTYAGAGWYIAILGGIILPIVAITLDVREGQSYVPPMTSSISKPMPMTPYVPPPAVTYNRKPAAPEPTPTLDAMDKKPVRRLSTPKTSTRKSKASSPKRKK